LFFLHSKPVLPLASSRSSCGRGACSAVCSCSSHCAPILRGSRVALLPPRC
jgi:hypothetical protein